MLTKILLEIKNTQTLTEDKKWKWMTSNSAPQIGVFNSELEKAALRLLT